jgi:hypothetical protein
MTRKSCAALAADEDQFPSWLRGVADRDGAVRRVDAHDVAHEIVSVAAACDRQGDMQASCGGVAFLHGEAKQVVVQCLESRTIVERLDQAALGPGDEMAAGPQWRAALRHVDGGDDSGGEYRAGYWPHPRGAGDLGQGDARRSKAADRGASGEVGEIIEAIGEAGVPPVAMDDGRAAGARGDPGGQACVEPAPRRGIDEAHGVRRDRGGHHRKRGGVEMDLPVAHDAEAGRADPGGDAAHAAQMGDDRVEFPGEVVARIDEAQRGIRARIEPREAGIGELVPVFGTGCIGGLEHGCPGHVPSRRRIAGRMRSTRTATPAGLGCIPSSWFRSGCAATPSRKKG